MTDLTPVSHIAGGVLRFGGIDRQRCDWCGALLVDRPSMAPEPGVDPASTFWPVGRFVDAYAGGMKRGNPWQPGEQLPETGCMFLASEVTV
jgi:hypothetical protein